MRNMNKSMPLTDEEIEEIILDDSFYNNRHRLLATIDKLKEIKTDWL